MEEAQSEAGTQHQFPCIQCGAQLAFAPGTSHLVCDYCGHAHQIAQSHEPILERDFYSTLARLPQAKADEVAMAVKCEACAAEFEFDRNIHADGCPFCGTRIVVDVAGHKRIRPWALLPFKVTSREATDEYRKWLAKLWFAPNKLKKYARKDSELNGMYVPYWTYDCGTQTAYTGERGTVYHVTVPVTSRVKGRMVTRHRRVAKIRWRPVSGQVQRPFDDVLIYASNSLPRSIARDLEPWDLENLAPYSEQYLSGFRSEIYSVGMEKGFDVARQRMHAVIRRDIGRDIGGDHQRIHRVDTRYDSITFKHLLLPFWVAGFRFRSKTYRFVVNGRTGEVQGERPWSIWKISFAVAAGLACLAVLMIAFQS